MSNTPKLFEEGKRTKGGGDEMEHNFAATLPMMNNDAEAETMKTEVKLQEEDPIVTIYTPKTESKLRQKQEQRARERKDKDITAAVTLTSIDRGQGKKEQPPPRAVSGVYSTRFMYRRQPSETCNDIYRYIHIRFMRDSSHVKRFLGVYVSKRETTKGTNACCTEA